MSKTITIDSAPITRVQLLLDATGAIQVFAEYQLKAGDTILQLKHEEVTPHLSGLLKAALQSSFQSVAQDVSTFVLA